MRAKVFIWIGGGRQAGAIHIYILAKTQPLLKFTAFKTAKAIAPLY